MILKDKEKIIEFNFKVSTKDSIAIKEFINNLLDTNLTIYSGFELKDIIKFISNELGLSPSLIANSLKKEGYTARGYYYFIAKRLTSFTNETIGKQINHKSPEAVMALYKKCVLKHKETALFLEAKFKEEHGMK